LFETREHHLEVTREHHLEVASLGAIKLTQGMEWHQAPVLLS